ncbi:MAG: hypothetical protein PHU33_17745, partial [Bacteroidales bacterium]|nr:hypothetical protein [Bacteroidales bacterium]
GDIGDYSGEHFREKIEKVVLELIALGISQGPLIEVVVIFHYLKQLEHLNIPIIVVEIIGDNPQCLIVVDPVDQLILVMEMVVERLAVEAAAFSYILDTDCVEAIFP